MTHSIALIADIVDSRRLTDRAHAQASIAEVFTLADAVHPPHRALWATVGDEFQAVYRDLGSALGATTLVRLSLPAGVDLRFGLGAGVVRDIAPGPAGPIQDGSAWIAARAAIDEAHRRQSRSEPSLRSWFRTDGSRGEEAVVNAFLLMRDHTITRMKARERRVAAAVLSGATQAEAATAEQISQSAVSQSLRRSGAGALEAAQRLFGKEAPR